MGGKSERKQKTFIAQNAGPLCQLIRGAIVFVYVDACSTLIINSDFFIQFFII